MITNFEKQLRDGFEIHALILFNDGTTKLSTHTYNCATFLQAVHAWLSFHLSGSVDSVLLEDYHSGNRFQCNFDYPVHCDSDCKDKYADPCDWRPFP